MPWWDDVWEGVDDFFPDPPDANDILFGDASTMDPHAQELLFDWVGADYGAERDAAYDRLVDYMMDEYGIDFEDAFDWQDFAEWYESQ